MTLTSRSLLFCAIASLVALACILSPATLLAQETAKRKSQQADVILVRGGFNVFSVGLDAIATKLKKRGVKSQLFRHGQIDEITATLLKNQKKNRRRPIILIGHSWGANAVLRIAKTLQKHRLKVRYMVTIAATNPNPAPANIRELTNYYFKQDGWGKPVRKAYGFKGRLTNIDMSSQEDVHHFNLDDQPEIQSKIVKRVVRLVRGRRYAADGTDSQQIYSAGATRNPEG